MVCNVLGSVFEGPAGDFALDDAKVARRRRGGRRRSRSSVWVALIARASLPGGAPMILVKG